MGAVDEVGTDEREGYGEPRLGRVAQGHLKVPLKDSAVVTVEIERYNIYYIRLNMGTAVSD